jgi:replicative DNA helicase
MALNPDDDNRPASQHAERTILGATLVEPLAIEEAVKGIQWRDFSLSSHQEIFKAVTALYGQHVPIDLISLGNELRRRNQLDSVGGLSYLYKLSEGLPRKLSIESYVRIVREKALLREGMRLCDKYMIQFADAGAEAPTLLAQMQMELMELSADAPGNQAETLKTIMPRVIERITQERNNPSTEEALGYTYGIREVDRFTKGAFANEYTLIAGETGGAKTAWMTQILLDNALMGRKCLLFSMEMTALQMGNRLLSSAARFVKASEIRDPRTMGIHEYDDAKKTAAKLEELGIIIDDTRQLPLDQLLARARAAIFMDEVKIIGVDYLQLVRSASGIKYQTDVERIEATTLGLRDLAAYSKEYSAHVIALSQYSRPADGGKSKPQNSRAKGSSSIEQSAQVFFHIIREELEDGSMSTDVEIRIGKQREGKRGTVRCRFNEDHLRFESV